MKRILSLLTALTLTASGATSVVSCGTQNTPPTDKDKANDIAHQLNNKPISFTQSGTITKVSDYQKQIQDELNKVVKQTPTEYSFVFDGSKDTSLSIGKPTNIKIKVKVKDAESGSISISITLNKATESDKQKANDIAHQLNNKPISFTQSGTKTKVSDYQKQIQDELNKVVKQTPTEYSFVFDGSKDTSLSIGKPTNIKIKVKVKDAESDSISISITLNKATESDKQKANDIVNTLNQAKIDPIKLDINKDNKQTLPDYFKSDIKAKLDAKLTATEKTYDYSIVNTDKITNTAKDFDVKVKIGNATSTTSFKLNFVFNYKKIDSIGANDTILYITQINNKIYVGTDKGLYISSDGTNFSKVTGVLDNHQISIIIKLKNKIYVGVYDGGLYVSSDTTGTNFVKVTGDIGTKKINTITEIDYNIYVGTNSNGLYVSGDGTSFWQVKGVLQTAKITNIIEWNNKIYVGTANGGSSTNYGLYVSSDGTSFSQLTGILEKKDVNAISIINNKIYVGTDKGLYVSSDGTSFTVVPSIIVTISIYTITKINNKIYVGTTKGLYVSSDGASFSAIPSIPNDRSIGKIKQIKNIIYIITDKGMYISKDDGLSFSIITDFSKDNIIWRIMQIDNKIYVGTIRKGLYYNFVA